MTAGGFGLGLALTLTLTLTLTLIRTRTRDPNPNPSLSLERDDGRRREIDDGGALPSPLATEPPSPHSAKAAVWPSTRPSARP